MHKPSIHAFKNGFSLLATTVIGLILVLGLQGCSSDDDDPGTPVPVAQTDPKGYYTGSADVKDANDADLRIDDLQGMVSGSRFMFMSEANTLLYDGTITDITDNDFTAEVTIYKDGTVADTTTVTGTITQESQITGNFTGAGAFNGTFTLVYDLSNSEASAISKVENVAGEYWRGRIGFETYQIFSINDTGVISDFDAVSDGPFVGCTITTGSSISPIADTRLYVVTFEFTACDAEGPIYTGFATTRSVDGTDNVLVLAIADGILGGLAEYTLFLFP